MQFIRLPKPIDIAKRVLPEPVRNWLDTKSVQSNIVILLQQLWVHIRVSGVIELSKTWMPHWHTFRNFTHWAWALWDFGNHDLILIIRDQGSQQKVTLSLESICTIPSQAMASDGKMPRLGQHSSNCGIPCFVNVLGTFQGMVYQFHDNPEALYRCAAAILSNITNCDI